MNDEKNDRDEFAKLISGRNVTDIKPSSSLSAKIMDAVSEEAAREEFQEIISGHTLQTLEPSAGLADRISAAVAATHRRELFIRKFAKIASAVAAVLAVAFIVGIALNSENPASALVAVNSTSELQPVNMPEFGSKIPSQASDENDAVVLADKAADWLVSCQQNDGTWSPAQSGGNEAFRPALTALAMMALQRHAPGRHADAVSRAAEALAAMQQPDGSFSTSPSSKLYNHAFASYALLDFSSAHDGIYTANIDKAIAFSIANQNDSGSWDYTLRDPGNTALTVWQAGFLLKAKAAGWNDSDGHLRRGLAWLRRRGHDGTFDYRETLDRNYTPYSGSLTLTAMATATLLDAAETYPELKETALNAVDALQASCERMPDYSESGHYRDYFLCKIYTSRDDTEAQKLLTRQIIHNHSREMNAVAPWKAKDIWATTGGDLYATVMAMLSVNRGI